MTKPGAPAAPGALKLMHVTRMPIRWGDMDAMGHVNNTVYFRYIESARIEWFSQLGCAPDPEGEGPVIVSAHCSFMKQLRYPGTIEVRTLVGPPGRSSFAMSHEIYLLESNGECGAVHAQGGATVVWLNFPAEKSVPLPQTIRAILPGE